MQPAPLGRPGAAHADAERWSDSYARRDASADDDRVPDCAHGSGDIDAGANHAAALVCNARALDAGAGANGGADRDTDLPATTASQGARTDPEGAMTVNDYLMLALAFSGAASAVLGSSDVAPPAIRLAAGAYAAGCTATLALLRPLWHADQPEPPRDDARLRLRQPPASPPPGA